MQDEITIVGAGIGGLTLARALEQRNIPFQLYEQAESFEALGYGLQISPNVVRLLNELGVEPQLERVSHRCLGFELRSFDTDQVLAKWDLDCETPYYHCRRADLHQLLFNAIQDKSKIHFSRRLESYQETGDQLSLIWENAEPITANALIGADGVRSVVRRSLFPQYEIQYAGYAAFRAILPFQQRYRSFWGKATVWMGNNHHVVVYPTGDEQPGKFWLNLVLVVKDPNWQGQGWTIPADKKAIAQEFANQSEALNGLLEDLTASPEPCFKWGLFIHPPLPYWSNGKVTLLGDAAHPMLPFQAQGAAMGIEDSYVLAAYLARENDIETALKKYQDTRIQRATQVQQVSRNNAKIFHASGVTAAVRNLALGLISAINPNLLNQKSAWIYDYEVKIV